MKLSILICSLYSRENNFLKELLVKLLPQIGSYSSIIEEHKSCEVRRLSSNNVEVVICIDNKKMRVGEKRNFLMSLARGDYFVFVDDDDMVTEDYVRYLLKGIEKGNDVIVFDVEISINGGKYKKVFYDADFYFDFDMPNSYRRIPNHIMCWNRKIAKEKFPRINMGEDAKWAKKMQRHIKSQTKIEKTLYYYNFNHKTTETQ